MIHILSCFAAALLLQIVTPWWWWIIVVPFIYGVLKADTGGRTFLLGFISMGALWLAGGIYDYFTGSQIIASRISQMLGVNSVYLLFILVALMAALCGGVSAITGRSVRRLFRT
jgi:hypothetical protein